MNEHTPHDPTAHDPKQADPGTHDRPEAAAESAGPGADLNPEEHSDVMETLEEAKHRKQTREDKDDDDLINLDPGD